MKCEYVIMHTGNDVTICSVWIIKCNQVNQPQSSIPWPFQPQPSSAVRCRPGLCVMYCTHMAVISTARMRHDKHTTSVRSIRPQAFEAAMSSCRCCAT